MLSDNRMNKLDELYEEYLQYCDHFHDKFKQCLSFEEYLLMNITKHTGCNG